MDSSRIKTLLDDLRAPKKSEKILFENYLEDAWKLFGFPDEADLASFEGFLIEAVSQVFKDAEHNIKNAKKRDACLVGLGLIKGCYHTETVHGVSTHCDVQTRYAKYLSGDYVKLSYPTPKEGKNFDITDCESLPRKAFAKSDERARSKLIRHLISMGAINSAPYQECLQAGRDKYTEQVVVTDGESEREVRRVILPSPCYTLENFPLKSAQQASEPDPEPTNIQDVNIAASTTGHSDLQSTSSKEVDVQIEEEKEAGSTLNGGDDSMKSTIEEGNSTNSGRGNKQSTAHDSPPKGSKTYMRCIVINIKLFGMPLLVAAIVGVVFFYDIPARINQLFAQFTNQHPDSATVIPIEEIHIYNKEFLLEPGESEQLKIGWYPINANISINPPQYFSDNPDVAKVEEHNGAWFVFATADEWNDEACHNANVFVQSGTATDQKQVTIVKPDMSYTNDIPNAISGGGNKDSDQTIWNE